eukprot:scaffold132_cov238-Chaetoceros_neogracile.AAC.2
MKTRTGALVASSLLVGSAEGLIGPSKSIQPRKRNSNVVAFATLPDRGSDISASFVENSVQREILKKQRGLTLERKAELLVEQIISFENKAENQAELFRNIEKDAELGVASAMERVVQKREEQNAEDAINKKYAVASQQMKPNVATMGTMSTTISSIPERYFTYESKPVQQKKKKELSPEELRAIEKAVELGVEEQARSKMELETELVVQKLVEERIERQAERRKERVASAQLSSRIDNAFPNSSTTSSYTSSTVSTWGSISSFVDPTKAEYHSDDVLPILAAEPDLETSYEKQIEANRLMEVEEHFAAKQRAAIQKEAEMAHQAEETRQAEKARWVEAVNQAEEAREAEAESQRIVAATETSRQRMAAEQEAARLNDIMSTALDEARNNISQLQNDLEKEQSQVISLRTNIEGLAASSQKEEVANKKQIEDMISKQKLDFETTLKSHEDRFKSEMAVVNKKKLALESEMAEKMQELVMAMDSIEELSTSVEEGKSYDEVAEKYTLLILTVEEKDAAIKSLEDSIAQMNDEH